MEIQKILDDLEASVAFDETAKVHADPRLSKNLVRAIGGQTIITAVDLALGADFVLGRLLNSGRHVVIPFRGAAVLEWHRRRSVGESTRALGMALKKWLPAVSVDCQIQLTCVKGFSVTGKLISVSKSWILLVDPEKEQLTQAELGAVLWISFASVTD